MRSTFQTSSPDHINFGRSEVGTTTEGLRALNGL